METAPKILAIQFKYFGDAVLMTPALRALRERFPEGALHALVPEEIAPLLEHLPWLNRVWPMPRRRGHAGFKQTWPVISALRREHFDRSVDFAGNDRGAILSLLAGARQRLGPVEAGGFLGRRFCYNRRVPSAPLHQHESLRLAEVLAGWDIPPPVSLEPEIRADPALAGAAQKILPLPAVICHMASSQPNRQWPVKHWAAFCRLAAAAGWRLTFTTARGVREQALTVELNKLAPDASVLPLIPEMPLFLAVLRRAAAFISGDTGPLHFAAGLGVPTISLFGPSSPARWAPVGKRHRVLTGSPCFCDGHASVCQSARHCLKAITPEEVLDCLQAVLASNRSPRPQPDDHGAD
ncbi:MAG: glycosyltransferase family 9 protein [Verrucomicrobiota bacterium]|nr:glycosyltransferase family 9 protein [Verrucomicrobiota bacterium]